MRGEVGWFTRRDEKYQFSRSFFEHLAVFEGDYSEYIYESEDSIKDLLKIHEKTLIYSAYFINLKIILKGGCKTFEFIVYYTSSLDCRSALVAKLVDAQDLKSCGLQTPCRFDSGRAPSIY